MVVWFGLGRALLARSTPWLSAVRPQTKIHPPRLPLRPPSQGQGTPSPASAETDTHSPPSIHARCELSKWPPPFQSPTAAPRLARTVPAAPSPLRRSQSLPQHTKN